MYKMAMTVKGDNLGELLTAEVGTQPTLEMSFSFFLPFQKEVE